MNGMEDDILAEFGITLIPDNVVAQDEDFAKIRDNAEVPNFVDALAVRQNVQEVIDQFYPHLEVDYASVDVALLKGNNTTLEYVKIKESYNSKLSTFSITATETHKDGEYQSTITKNFSESIQVEEYAKNGVYDSERGPVVVIRNMDTSEVVDQYYIREGLFFSSSYLDSLEPATPEYIFSYNML